MVYLRNRTRKHPLALARIERSAEGLLAAVGRPGASVSLTFVSDAAMVRLNREHRGRNATTDVLSFPLYDPFAVPTLPPAGHAELMLGDIVISLATARRQAQQYGAVLEAEVERLLVHAMLHLLGHDHEAPRERARMVREEKRLAAAIGLAWPYDGH